MTKEELQGRIPPVILGALERYVDDGIPPGSCTTAILCGDLYGAATAADPETIEALGHIALYVYLYLPLEVWGSLDAVHEHCKRMRAEFEEACHG